jgi:general secretion pathway protein F
MPIFRYTALSPAGELERGRVEAADHAGAIAAVQALGRIPVRAQLAGRARWTAALFAGRSLPGRELALLARGLACLLQAGVGLDHGLELLAGALRGPAARRTVLALRESVRAGLSLSDAMAAQRPQFTRFAIAMLRAAEAGGTLEAGLACLAEHEERSQALKERIVSALIYPAVLAVVAAGSLAILLVYVVPQFTPLFRDAGRALPASTEFVVGAAALLREAWWALAAGAIAAALGLRAALAAEGARTRLDALVLRLPLAGELVRAAAMARMSRSLAALLASGVPLLGAVAIVRDVLGNRVLAGALEVALEALRGGRSLAGPLLATGAFPALGVQMIRVGETSGRLAEMLARVAELYEREVASATQRLLALLEPALIVGLGVAVGGVILSLLSAIVALNDLPL